MIDFDSQTLTFEASVGKGTYIRTLAQDIAIKLGTVGYVDQLIRVEDAGANLEQCLDWQWFEQAEPGEINSKILDITQLSIPTLPRLKIQQQLHITNLFQGKEVEITLDQESKSQLEIHSSSTNIDTSGSTCQQVRMMDKENRTLGIAQIMRRQNNKVMLKLKRGLI